MWILLKAEVKISKLLSCTGDTYSQRINDESASELRLCSHPKATSNTKLLEIHWWDLSKMKEPAFGKHVLGKWRHFSSFSGCIRFQLSVLGVLKWVLLLWNLYLPLDKKSDQCISARRTEGSFPRDGSPCLVMLCCTALGHRQPQRCLCLFPYLQWAVSLP